MTQFSSLYTTYLDEELGTDDSTVLFTTARRKAAINKGADRFASLTECLVRSTSFTVVSGTAEYDLNSTLVIQDGDFQGFDKIPAQFLAIQSSTSSTVLVTTYLAGRDQFVRRDIDWILQHESGSINVAPASTSAVQFPRYYYVYPSAHELLLGLYPMPQFTTSYAATVTVSYIADTPVMSSATDEPFQFNGLVRKDLRAYHQGVVHYAAHQLEKLRKDDAAADRQLKKFNDYVVEYLQSMRIKGGRQIRQARSYFQRGG